jgi:hypothetical protein
MNEMVRRTHLTKNFSVQRLGNRKNSDAAISFTVFGITPEPVFNRLMVSVAEVAFAFG